MNRLRYYVVLALLALGLPSSRAWGALSDYEFTQTTGSRITPSTLNALWTGYDGGSRWDQQYRDAIVDLPFTFTFNGVQYNELTISSMGAIGLGTYVPVTTGNSLAGYSTPLISAYWDDITITGSAPGPGCNLSSRMNYGVSGSYPNRIFVINYQNVGYGGYPIWFNYQVRLYECSNEIEFWYDQMSGTWATCASRYWGTGSTSTSGTIGIAADSRDYMSVSMNSSGTATMSRTSSNDNLNVNSTQVPEGTVFKFTPMPYRLTGNVAQGGVNGMPSGSTLLTNISVQRGSSQVLQPTVLTPASADESCGTPSVTMTITGTHASDYSISPSGTVPISVGVPVTPSITFTPSALGVRTATLTLRSNNGLTRSYTLAATGTQRMLWISNAADGGTPTIANGDTLMRNIIVVRPGQRDLSPITIRNFNPSVTSTPAIIRVSIDSAGFPSQHFQLMTPDSINLGGTQSHSPVIRFTTHGVGVQSARMRVTADGETRTYRLQAISGAPMIIITAEGRPIDSDNPLYLNALSCVGNEANSLPLVITNPGTVPLVITDVAFFATDTTDRQGTPLFPLVRDSRGRALGSADYVLSMSPAAPPLTPGTSIPLPITVQPGSSQTIYSTFVGQIPGRRFGRVYIRTNAQNIYGTDTTLDGALNSVMGLQTFDLTARAIGSRLAATTTDLSLKPIVFPHTKVGESSMMSFTIANTGACDLRINRNKLRVSSGDVNEFKMMTSLTNSTLDATTGDYVLAPGQVDTVTVRFQPSRAGTRMSTLWIQTNDSTIHRPGLAERGAYYLDLSGRGLAGLDSRELVLDPVVIGSSVAGTVTVENTLNTAVGVGYVGFEGDDAAQFAEDNAAMWPARPFTVLPGEKTGLNVRLTPTGNAGARRTTMIFVTTTNDTVRVPIRGEAGVQTLVVSPNALFTSVTIPSGQIRRQSVMIANDGTLPVRILSIAIAGVDSSSYVLGKLPRLDLEAGQTEYLEVAFAPSASGQTSAELVISASNGQTYTVTLGGTALKSRVDPKDPTTTTLPGDDAPVVDSRRDRNGRTTDDRPTLR